MRPSIRVWVLALPEVRILDSDPVLGMGVDEICGSVEHISEAQSKLRHRQRAINTNNRQYHTKPCYHDNTHMNSQQSTITIFVSNLPE